MIEPKKNFSQSYISYHLKMGTTRIRMLDLAVRNLRRKLSNSQGWPDLQGTCVCQNASSLKRGWNVDVTPEIGRKPESNNPIYYRLVNLFLFIF